MRRARAHVTKSSAIRNILIYMGIDSMILIQQLRRFISWRLKSPTLGNR